MRTVTLPQSQGFPVIRPGTLKVIPENYKDMDLSHHILYLHPLPAQEGKGMLLNFEKPSSKRVKIPFFYSVMTAYDKSFSGVGFQYRFKFFLDSVDSKEMFGSESGPNKVAPTVTSEDQRRILFLHQICLPHLQPELDAFKYAF